jgi:hypothetical protein
MALKKILAALAAVTIGVCIALAAASGASARPVILIVPRSQVIHEMQLHYWCSHKAAQRPGWFTCTPVAPR